PMVLGGDTAQDLAPLDRGRVAVLDRLGDRNVQIYGSDGKLQGEVDLVGKHIPEGGGTTGVFSDGRGVYVEWEHRMLVRIADANGMSDPERPTLPGRPRRDGRGFLSFAVTDK